MAASIFNEKPNFSRYPIVCEEGSFSLEVDSKMKEN